MEWFVYILECADGSLYTGITNDLKKRLSAHKAGTASRYTRAHGAKKFIYKKKVASKSDALKQEIEIKKLSREKKLQLIKKKLPSPRDSRTGQKRTGRSD